MMNGHDTNDIQDDGEERLAQCRPGDVLDVWEEGHRLVTTVYVCREVVDARTYRWYWLFLDDNSLLEVSPDGVFRYREHQLVRQGTVLYESLVAQDGALVRFEEHVRAGSSARRPVHVTIADREYRIASTGTVAVERFGTEPTLLPWASFHVNAEENVYFGLVSVDDEEQVGLGLWTAHVCLSFGTTFDPSNITGVFRQGTR